jgi:hypothetical protein
MADGCLGHLTSPLTGSEHPKNRARSISQRVTGTKEEPQCGEVVARLRIAASFAFRSVPCPREDASGARELTRGRDKTQIGVFVPVRNSFGVCFHGLGRFLNGGVFRVGFCAEPCAGRGLRPCAARAFRLVWPRRAARIITSKESGVQMSTHSMTDSRTRPSSCLRRSKSPAAWTCR